MFSYKSKILAASISSMLMLVSCSAENSNKSAASSDVGPSIATVNGTPISKAHFDFMLQQSQLHGQPDSPEAQKKIREKMILEEIVAQEAIKKGIDKLPDVNTQINLARQSILIRAYLQDFVNNAPLGDDALKAEYDKANAQGENKEYHSRHILVENEADAKDIIAKLNQGEKFEKLAKKSMDPGSKDNGGDLGWVTPASFVPEFSAAMTKLQNGQYTTEPVKSQFGWHIIKLEGSRAVQAPPFEEVKQELRQRTQQQLIDKMIVDLRAKAKVVETADTAVNPATDKK